jgi:hypothetical protein
VAGKLAYLTQVADHEQWHVAVLPGTQVSIKELGQEVCRLLYLSHRKLTRSWDWWLVNALAMS